MDQSSLAPSTRWTRVVVSGRHPNSNHTSISGPNQPQMSFSHCERSQKFLLPDSRFSLLKAQYRTVGSLRYRYLFGYGSLRSLFLPLLQRDGDSYDHCTRINVVSFQRSLPSSLLAILELPLCTRPVSIRLSPFSSQRGYPSPGLPGLWGAIFMCLIISWVVVRSAIALDASSHPIPQLPHGGWQIPT